MQTQKHQEEIGKVEYILKHATPKLRQIEKFVLSEYLRSLKNGK